MSTDAERRQLTVMFCDLADSTPLAHQLDPEDVREVMHAYTKACAPIIETLDGHVAQILGDGLLVYFGYPTAHENDALRATRAALRILGEMPRLNAEIVEQLPDLRDRPLAVRIGIHTGPVVVGGGPSEPVALGDTVNIAARLQSATEPGTAVVSDATRRLVRDAFVFEDQGEKALKGIAEPVSFSRVVGATEAETSHDPARTRLTPLVGREQELGLLLDRWEEARSGAGRVVLLSGETGMGKSRLVEALRERVAETPHLWLECRCSPYREHSALHPLIVMLQKALRLTDDLSDDAKITRLEEAFDAAGFDVAETLPLYAGLLSIELPDRYAPSAAGLETQRRRLLESLVAWVLHLAGQRPLVLIAEDLHWVDPSNLELLGMVIEQVPTSALLMFFTFRPEFEPPWPSRSHMAHLPLHALTRKQMTSLVDGVAGGKKLPAKVLEQIVSKTDGVPLFVEELTKSVIESDLLRESDTGYERADPLPTLSVPSTLQDSLMARLDRLGPGKEVAQVAAVLGREFSYELLAAVASLEPERLDQGLEELAGAELVYRRGVPPSAIYSFKHAMVQDTAYESLLKKRRRELHARAAEVLAQERDEGGAVEPEDLARHYRAAGLVREAIAQYEQAAQKAKQKWANTEATAHLTDALGLVEMLSEAPDRLQSELALQLSLGATLQASRGWGSADVESAYGRARELCNELGESPRLYDALIGLITYYTARSQLQTAYELCEQLLRLAEHKGDAALVLAHEYLANVLYFLGQPARSLEHHDRAIKLDRPSLLGSFPQGTHPGVTGRVWSAWALWMLGHPDKALARSREAIKLARETGNPFFLAYALSWGSVVDFMRQEREPARERAEEAIEIASEQGFPLQLGLGRLIRVWGTTDPRDDAERLEANLAEVQDAMAQLGATGTEAAGPQILGGLARVVSEAGRSQEALGFVEAGLAMSERTGQPYWDSELLRVKGELLLARGGGEEKEAEALFRRALELARSQEARSLELRTATSLARMLCDRRKKDEARTLLAEVYDWFSEGFETGDLREAKALLEELG